MISNKKTAIVTGSAGFIGFHMSKKLIDEGWEVIGIDNLNSYYDRSLKIKRHDILKNKKFFKEYIGNLEDLNFINEIILSEKPTILIHLAAQAGVRYSIENPDVYMQSNIIGTFNIIETLKKYKIKHFLVSSTSSVYGNSKDLPFTENSNTDYPVSFYASTKKSMEVLTHNYSHLYKIPTTIFRFFTVYGPWGRPDMALFKFTEAILKNKPIQIYNNGNMIRDFTYIDDIITGIFKLVDVIPLEKDKRDKKISNDSISNFAPWRVVNIGNAKPIKLLQFIKILERCLGKKARKKFVPYQKGEVFQTCSNNILLKNLTSYEPDTDLEIGIKKFLDWYQTYFNKY